MGTPTAQDEAPPMAQEAHCATSFQLRLPAKASHAQGADSRFLPQFRTTPRALACLATQDGNGYPKPEYPTGFTR